MLESLEKKMTLGARGKEAHHGDGDTTHQIMVVRSVLTSQSSSVHFQRLTSTNIILISTPSRETGRGPVVSIKLLSLHWHY